ncbi:hypothetical protein [Albimonas pacifica]|uniref:Uncharacterized protein n=1 Tax=Albimonas pacifica TaxID=1114924 RepID=A0A1I3CJX4_9RHOB|nr:hypothetical protein [Albimonas pacifica]SFH74623.1 hypothetical protein SAMN05216258_10234 [Albimonas pacifica]
MKAAVAGQDAPRWRRIVDAATPVLYAEDAPRAAVEKELRRMDDFAAAGPKGAARPEFRIMHDLARWRLSGEYAPGYESLNEARLQFWHLEKFCPVLDFQKRVLEATVADYPGAEGPAKFLSIYRGVTGPVDPRFDDVTRDIVIFRRPGATLTVIAFSGLQGMISGVGFTMYDRAVTQKLGANLIVVRDLNRLFYLGGLRCFGPLEQSIEGLRGVLAEFAGTRIVAAGGSAGVFGALLMSPALGIRHVVASSGPTSLDIGLNEGDRQRYMAVKEAHERGEAAYPDLVADVVASDIERIEFFVGGDHDYDLRQMRNIEAKCPAVRPHVVAGEASHSVLDKVIADGSYLAAFD